PEYFPGISHVLVLSLGSLPAGQKKKHIGRPGPMEGFGFSIRYGFQQDINESGGENITASFYMQALTNCFLWYSEQLREGLNENWVKIRVDKSFKQKNTNRRVAEDAEFFYSSSLRDLRVSAVIKLFIIIMHV